MDGKGSLPCIHTAIVEHNSCQSKPHRLFTGWGVGEKVQEGLPFQRRRKALGAGEPRGHTLFSSLLCTELPPPLASGVSAPPAVMGGKWGAGEGRLFDRHIRRMYRVRLVPPFIGTR